jgi:micrococcal nuclease
MVNIKVSLLLVALLIPATAFAGDFSGPVVSVLDGDTVEVLHTNRAERIRLNGIDCPEKGQAYGKRAKQAASELVFGKEVTLQTFGKDKYGRTIADVLLPDGTNVNHGLVKDGWCCSYSFSPFSCSTADVRRVWFFRTSRCQLWRRVGLSVHLDGSLARVQ